MLLEDTIKNEKTYDSVFWTSVIKMTKFFIPLVNEAFGEHFTDSAKITLLRNRQAIELTDKSLEQGITDVLAELSEGDITKDYHFEVETWDDRTFAIRIAEYASRAAYESITLTESGAEMTVPYSAVIFLKAGNMPPNFIIDIKYPGGVISYEAPVLLIKNYTVRELIDKRLLLLLPFFGVNYDGRFAEMEENGIDDLRDAMDELGTGLNRLKESGVIDEAQKKHLLEWTKRVLNKLTLNYNNVSKGVNQTMGGYLIRTETDDILDQGIEQGIKQARSDIIINMLRKGYTPEEISSICGIPHEEVREVEQSLLIPQ